jgi:hypothetical protein
MLTLAGWHPQGLAQHSHRPRGAALPHSCLHIELRLGCVLLGLSAACVYCSYGVLRLASRPVSYQRNHPSKQPSSQGNPSGGGGQTGVAFSSASSIGLHSASTQHGKLNDGGDQQNDAPHACQPSCMRAHEACSWRAGGAAGGMHTQLLRRAQGRRLLGSMCLRRPCTPQLPGRGPCLPAATLAPFLWEAGGCWHLMWWSADLQSSMCAAAAAAAAAGAVALRHGHATRR